MTLLFLLKPNLATDPYKKSAENNTRGFLKTGKDDNLFLNVEAIGKLAD